MMAISTKQLVQVSTSILSSPPDIILLKLTNFLKQEFMENIY